MLRSTGATASPRAIFDRLVSRIAVDSEERELAGVVSGLLYVSGGATLSLFMVLPGVSRAHPVALLVDSGVACAWGAISVLLIPWPKAPRWLIHVSLTAGFAAITVAVASSGGGGSPAWLYLYFIAVFAAYFFTPTVAAVYVAGCVAAHALPLLYDQRAPHSSFGVQLLIGATSYVALGGAVAAGKHLTLGLRTRSEQLAAEQGSLRRVATAVVGGEPAERIYELVAVESAGLLGAGAAGILRLDTPDRATVMGSWADHPGGRYEPGTSVPVRPGTDVARALETNLAVRVENHERDSPVGRLGYNSSIIAPIRVDGRNWGALAVTVARPARFTRDDEDRLKEFGDLLATAITSIEDRAKLAAQASTDPLTGLANHRTLHQRLAVELARAKRYDTRLSVAVLDIDHFKQLNDAGGHETGDELLVRVAGCLSRVARTADMLGRVGGDEFAWIFPETSREGA
ncbi:MAG: hypothetical protein QOD66_133, partial [Solirubrobacteraceae bacterium]|nr:hypothetical protein [Solirubrobacteraceae bacterium]